NSRLRSHHKCLQANLKSSSDLDMTTFYVKTAERLFCSLLWRRSRGGWHRLPIRRLGFHQLNPCAIGIEGIGLALNVPARLDLNLLSIILVGRTRFEGRHRLFYVRHNQANMILDPHLRFIQWRLV